MNMKSKLLNYGCLALVMGLAVLFAAPADALAAVHSVNAHAQSLSGDILSASAMALAGLGRIKVLRDKKASLLKEADAINEKIDAGKAEDEDTARLAALTDEGGELDKVNASIKREERLMEERRSMEAVSDVNADTAAEAADRLPATAKKPEEKFASFGEQMTAVARAGINGDKTGESDRRLHGLFQPGGVQADGTGLNEGVPSEGGFLVQQDLAAPMLESMFNTGTILPRVRRLPVSANSNGMKLHALDETSRANGSRFGGVRGYWASEAGTVNASQPKFREMDLRLNKLMGISYVTEEMLADSMFLGAFLGQAFTEELTFKTEDGIINGTGSGQMLGILNSGAVVSVAKESGQAAATIVSQNVLNMFARLMPRSTTRAVWLINQNCLPQLWNLTLGSGAAVTLLYSPPGQGTQDQNAPAGTLLGRPVIPVEYAASVGTVGDIMLVDLDQYLMIDKGGIQQNASMHVRFLYDEMTFRFTYRVDGQPLQRSAVTPFKGTGDTLSPYVTLATRG